MIKSLIHISLIASAVVATATIEAVLPLVIDGRDVPQYGYITNSREYGTLEGWQQCVTKTQVAPPADTPYSAYESCMAYTARIIENPAVSVAVSGFAAGNTCGKKDVARWSRAVEATVTNTSGDTHFFAVELQAENPGAHSAARQQRVNVELPPRTSKEVCFIAFAFETAAELEAFQRIEAQSSVRLVRGTGVAINGDKHTVFAQQPLSN
ncbi:hypothetical protein [Kordiimonas aestuarii]|uniref:hypothetical protein n=1 Tax=Kordiimonas aestuarii TaxID=1005925 RepID=UPI0021D14196|nr:hypothetical protein [Kordiimonas aestuarii]